MVTGNPEVAASTEQPAEKTGWWTKCKKYAARLGDRVRDAALVALIGTIATVILTWVGGYLPRALTWIPSDSWNNMLGRQVETDPALQGKKIRIINDPAAVYPNMGIGPDGVKEEYNARLYTQLRSTVASATPNGIVDMNANEAKLFEKGLRIENANKFQEAYGADVRTVIGWGGALLTVGAVGFQLLGQRKRENGR